MEIQPREIGNEEYVSQYGSRQTGQPVFRDSPRPVDRDGLSGVFGRVTAAEARRPVRQAGSPTEDDGVRHGQVGDLRERGFVVSHTPSQRNTRHVSIRYPGVWDEKVTGMFNACFGAPQWYEEPKEGGQDE